MQAAEERLLTIKTQLEDAVGSMSQGLVMLDAQGRVVLCNPQSRRILDLPPDTPDPHALFDDLLDEVDSLADASCTKVREGGPGMTSEYGAYYCSSSERVTEAVQAFSDAADTLEVNDGSWESSEPVSEYPPSDATPSSSGEQRPRRRAVLVIVTDWPGGTMAFKFGSAMKAALQVQSEDIKLVQMGPERIFRAETDADERSFFEALSKSGVSYSGRVHFIEL
jgi:hypothetical protein